MPNAPSAWQIERALAVWKEAQEFTAGTADTDVHNFSAPAPTGVGEVIGELLRASVFASDMEEVAKARGKWLKMRQDRFAARAEKMKQLAHDLMGVIGERKIEFSDLTAFTREGQDGCIVTDESKVPAEYKEERTETVINKRKINEDIKQGVVIDGVERRNGVPSLIIKLN